MNELVPFLVQAGVISLSGVMAPGPVTATALQAGTRRAHAGALMGLGHGVVEFPLMAAIMLGAGAMLQSSGFRLGVGIAGGIALLGMAALMFRGLRAAGLQEEAAPPNQARPVIAGIVLSAGNPYFLIWWATVGLTLATRAMELGVLAFGLFAIIHWLCDVAWLEVLSVSSFHGTTLLGRRAQVAVTAICAATMAGFGAWYLIDAISRASG